MDNLFAQHLPRPPTPSRRPKMYAKRKTDVCLRDAYIIIAPPPSLHLPVYEISEIDEFSARILMQKCQIYQFQISVEMPRKKHTHSNTHKIELLKTNVAYA